MIPDRFEKCGPYAGPGSDLLPDEPSGTGKTTLFRILMGLEKADEGEIVWSASSGSCFGSGSDRDVSRPLRISTVFQEDRLCPQLNAIQNVELVLPEEKTKYREQIYNDFLQIGLDEAASRSRHESCPAGRNAVRPCCGRLGRERHSAAGRAVHRHGPRHHEKSRSAAEGALRRKGRSAGHPRSGGHSGAGVAGDGIITILPGCCSAR